MQQGLRELPHDERDYPLGAVFSLPKLKDLPASFSFPPFDIKNQGDTDFCTAFAFCAASELQEGVVLEPSYSFAMTKSIEGSHESWGADLRVAAQSHVKVGALEERESPYHLSNKQPEFLRNPECWPVNLMEKAAKHKKKTFFSVVGAYDHFDTIRAAIYKFRDKRQAVVLGVEWGWAFDDVYITELKRGGGHALCCLGWQDDYLVIQNSYGVAWGDNGVNYIHRSVINPNVDRFGAFMLVDIDRDTAQYMLDNNIKDTDGTLIAIIKALARFIRNPFSA